MDYIIIVFFPLVCGTVYLHTPDVEPAKCKHVNLVACKDVVDYIYNCCICCTHNCTTATWILQNVHVHI